MAWLPTPKQQQIAGVSTNASARNTVKILAGAEDIIDLRFDITYIGYPTGVLLSMSTTKQQSSLNRLKRIEGQVRGIARMIEEDRYCIDILHQIQAVKSAIARAESEILKDHAAHCVADAIAAGNKKDQREKVSELVDLFDKLKR
ncbi:MAG: metal-sensitive transcriptional regulator [Pseudomonadota bacterium]